MTEKTRFTTLPVPWTPETDFVNDHLGTLSIEMTIVHNVFIRALNSLYYNAPRVKKRDEASFVGYGLVFVEVIHEHHSVEEELIFPCIQPGSDMKANIEQHHAFHEGLDKLQHYFESVQNGQEVYDGTKVVDLLDTFGEGLVQHLNDEIPTLVPERLKEVNKQDFDDVFKELQNRIKSVSMTTVHSFVAVHHDKTTAPSWPPAPKIITWILSNIAYWRHSNYWKFAPFDRHGQALEYA